MLVSMRNIFRDKIAYDNPRTYLVTTFDTITFSISCTYFFTTLTRRIDFPKMSYIFIDLYMK